MSRGVYIAVLISCVLGVESVRFDSSLGIVDGQPVNITEVPFMATYGVVGRFFTCGAAIVHVKYLISSARCYYEMRQEPRKAFVRLGTDVRDGNGGEAYDVEDSMPHPYYKPHEFDYDIAVLRLAEQLTFSESVKAIPLADLGFTIPAAATFDVMGFGTTSPVDLKFPDKLQKVSVQHIASEKCKALFLFLTERMICAQTEWKGSCLFDEGGPLVYDNKLVGVTSLVGCGRKNFPTIYTYIPNVRDFIDSVIQS